MGEFMCECELMIDDLYATVLMYCDAVYLAEATY